MGYDSATHVGEYWSADGFRGRFYDDGYYDDDWYYDYYDYGDDLEVIPRDVTLPAPGVYDPEGYGYDDSPYLNGFDPEEAGYDDYYAVDEEYDDAHYNENYVDDLDQIYNDYDADVIDPYDRFDPNWYY
jgi:hypothetical protein